MGVVVGEWDNSKAESNEKKHTVSFDEALEAFDDPFYLEHYDSANSTLHEERYIVLGRVKRQIVVVVVYTPRGGKHRIISARFALAHERRVYYDRIKHLSNHR